MIGTKIHMISSKIDRIFIQIIWSFQGSPCNSFYVRDNVYYMGSLYLQMISSKISTIFTSFNIQRIGKVTWIHVFSSSISIILILKYLSPDIQLTYSKIYCKRSIGRYTNGVSLKKISLMSWEQHNVLYKTS